jgi:RNA polymerase sigma-70 factor (ECF subfamily)
MPTPPAASAGGVSSDEARPRLEEVFRDYHDFIWRSARRLGCPEALVDDAVQEVFLVAARRLDELESVQVLRTWIFRVTMNVVRNIRRSQARRESRHAAAGELARRYAPDPSERLAAADELLKLLDLLDEERRVVFVLSALEQMTAAEIAETIDVNVNTVYSRLRSARSRLERAIGEGGNHGREA